MSAEQLHIVFLNNIYKIRPGFLRDRIQHQEQEHSLFFSFKVHETQQFIIVDSFKRQKGTLQPYNLRAEGK